MLLTLRCDPEREFCFYPVFFVGTPLFPLKRRAFFVLQRLGADFRCFWNILTNPQTARTAGRCVCQGARTTPWLSPASPIAASPSAASRPQAVSFFVCRFHNAPARRRNVRFSGTWRVRARLCRESRTKRRHGRDGAGGAVGHSCISCICSDSDIFGCGSVVIAFH